MLYEHTKAEAWTAPAEARQAYVHKGMANCGLRRRNMARCNNMGIPHIESATTFCRSTIRHPYRALLDSTASGSAI
jgi:hypothetical protein